MGHNFVLLTKGTDAANFATAAMTGKATEYILSKGVLNHTKLIGGENLPLFNLQRRQKKHMILYAIFRCYYLMMKGGLSLNNQHLVIYPITAGCANYPVVFRYNKK